MSFWNTPRGKVMSHGIHDFNNGVSSADAGLKNLKNDIESGNTSKEEMLKRISRIEASFKRQQEAVDYMYEKIKELEV